MTALEDSLREILIAKVTELFEAYGVPCHVTEAMADEDVPVCGILGFFGTAVHGSIAVATSADVLARSNPIGGEFDRRWSAELTNQLVGRFKNELLRRGVEVMISLPIVLTSARLVPVPDVRMPLEFLVGEGVARVWLEVDGLVQLAGVPHEEIPQEGDVLLFD